MTTQPILSDADIEARIVSVAAALSQPLTAADTTWLVGCVRSWLSNYAFNEQSLASAIASWVRGCTPLVDMDGQSITIGTTLLVPFSKGGAGCNC